MMKKTYVKPMIQFEDFKLSASIALTCRFPAGHSEGECNFEDPDTGVIFFTGDVECKGGYVPSGDSSSVCYHNPGDNNIFDS